MPKYSDIQIKQGLLSSDGAMIRYVFYEHFTPMLRFNAQKVAGKKSVPFDDLVQELYLYMSRNDWEKLRLYDPELSFKKWFSVVSYRFFRDFTTSVIDSSQKIPISEMGDLADCVAGVTRTSMIMADIKAAIAKLWPPRDREVVEALVVNEEEPAEVAKRLDVTVDNLYNIKRRALAKLIRKHLHDYLNK
ncbi:MAG: sigma-70 family RNA polymerase sigma factor [Bacteroidales bacterium]|nr:sigma-70 family RNA polymerase sigma factor [Bacteroidales bacterium]